MARISQRSKDVFTVLLTIAVGLLTGIYVDVRHKPDERHLPLLLLIGVGLAQVILTALPSKDSALAEQYRLDAEKYRKRLEEYDKAEIAQLQLKNTYAAQALKLAEAGDLSESLRWSNASAAFDRGGKAMANETNEIYLTPSVHETLQSLDLSQEQAKGLDAAVNSLIQGIPQESRIVFADGTASGGLRELERNGWRIFFRYDPQQNAVMVADIRAKGYTTLSAGSHEEEIAVTA